MNEQIKLLWDAIKGQIKAFPAYIIILSLCVLLIGIMLIPATFAAKLLVKWATVLWNLI